MQPLEDAPALRDRRQVEWVPDPPDERLAKRAAPARDLVQVAATEGRVARVELPRDDARAQHDDVGRQLVVQRTP